jgi:predicted methyltransferase MtxX (methanogen marker protein 4)
METKQTLHSRLLQRAAQERKKIGIGITAPSNTIINGLKTVNEFCEPHVYGANIPNFACNESATPEDQLMMDLKTGKIDAAIRGQIEATSFRKRFVEVFNRPFQPIDEMITLVEFEDGRPLLFGTTANLSAGTIEEKARYIDASVQCCQLLDIPVKIGLLTQCREHDLAEIQGTSLVQMYHETNRLVEMYSSRHRIKNYEIDFENAYNDGVTILVEPNGTTGNQVLRTLYFLNVVRFYGAPYMNTFFTVLETFKNSKDFPDVFLLASALVNSKKIKALQ